MKIQIVTIFPELFGSALTVGMLGKAIGIGALDVGFVDPRDFATDKRRSIDDIPYGGGPGMVMRADLMIEAIQKAGGHAVMLTPRGAPLTQAHLSRWSKLDSLVLVAGRYEGIDERVTAAVAEQVSLGDFVLSGGEYAALAIVDGVARLLPEVLGNAASLEHESFVSGLLEHAQYTRPVEVSGAPVPEVYRGGDHASIASARRAEALARTRQVRPDLLARLGISDDDRDVLASLPSAAVAITVVMHPSGTPAEWPLEDWARLVAAYGLAGWTIVAPTDHADVLRARLAALALPRRAPAGRSRRARAQAAREAGAAAAWSRALASIQLGEVPPPGPTVEVVWATPEPRPAAKVPEHISGRALVLVLGGEPPEGAALLPAARVVAWMNRLGPVAGPAVVLDRLLGER